MNEKRLSEKREMLHRSLRSITTDKNIENEVCEEAIKIYLNKYGIYSQRKMSSKRMPQCTKGGWCLVKIKGHTSINIAGDILTGKDVFHHLEVDKDIQKLYTLFEDYYYTQGNMIPFPEGGNYGGVNCDSFTRTLNECKEAFENNNESYVNFITRKLEDGKTIGRYHRKSVHYWIKKEWLDKDECGKDIDAKWKTFVHENYLFDMVEDVKGANVPIAIVVGRENGNPVGIYKDDDKVKVVIPTIERLIKLIIQRSYRIETGIKEDFDKEDIRVLEECFEKIGLSQEVVGRISH